MRTEDKILKILQQHINGIMAEELYEELSTPMSDEEVHSACAFLKKYGLITVGYGGESAKITARGLQLLNLPSLLGDELPSDQLEVLERHWSDEMDMALDQEADLNLRQDPTIKVVGDNGTILEQTLWLFITRLIYEVGDPIFSGDIKVYLNDEEVQQPASMEDDPDEDPTICSEIVDEVAR